MTCTALTVVVIKHILRQCRNNIILIIKACHGRFESCKLDGAMSTLSELANYYYVKLNAEKMLAIREYPGRCRLVIVVLTIFVAHL